MAATLTQEEEAQLAQTIEMFEVITQSQPNDYQSLEILKEAYSKLGRQTEVVGTAKRIAQAYVEMGQLSSAILEYETILQQIPNDPDVQAALKDIESKANNVTLETGLGDTVILQKPQGTAPSRKAAGKPNDAEEGRKSMYKVFVDSRVIAAADFDLCWYEMTSAGLPGDLVEPFIQIVAGKGILPVEKSIKLLCDKTRIAYLPLEKYDIDMDLARTFPADLCKRWCVLPFDRMSKSILVATANPFNQQAAKELNTATPHRLLWYLVQPAELVRNLRKAFR